MLSSTATRENYFAEVEQAAFSPANIVPGIGFSPDKMLQARLFSLRRRAALPARRQLQPDPVNAPQCPFHSYHRDGAMRVDGNHGGTMAMSRTAYGEWPITQGRRTAAAAGGHGDALGPPRSTTTTTSSRARCSG